MSCGLLAGPHAMALDPGTRVRLPAGEPIVVWNDGPGPVVLLLRTVVRTPVPVLTGRHRS